MLKDIAPGAETAYPYSFGPFQGRLFFTVKDGKEIWSTDGTEAGTILLKTIYSGTESIYPGAYGYFEWNGKLYFTANDGVHGGELWVSDGTGEGTSLFKDINPGPDGSGPGGQTVFENKLYFYGSDATYGYQLFVTDATPEGTQLVAPFNPEINSVTYSAAPLEFNGTLYYTALYDSLIGREIYYLAPGTIGMEKFNAANASVYPNPSNGIFAVQSKNQIQQISLFDLAGNMVITQKGINSILQDWTAAHFQREFIS